MGAEKSARPPWWKRWFGSRSEGAAEKFLKGLGFRILARNYSCKLGELDLVALEGSCIVFIEVRSTAAADPLRAALSVNPAKQRRLTRLAQYFLKHKRLLDRPARFDVLAVAWPDDRDNPVITHYRNAFEAVGD